MGGRIAIVPARGGSKRFPRKNIVDFLGKPILGYTLEACLQSAIFDRMVVSTEDPEIAEISKQFGASVVSRPDALAADNIGVVDVCLQVLDSEEADSRSYDVMCCLYPTAPLRTSADIEATVALLAPGVCDFSLAVARYQKPPHQALRLLPTEALEPVWPDLVSKRDEEIGNLVVDNGSTYAVMVTEFRRNQSFYGPRLRGHLMPEARSIDINYPEDLKLAEYYSRQAAS